MTKQTFIFLLLSAFIGFIACEEPAIAPDFGIEYFPTELGLTRIYQIDSVIYDPNGVVLIDTVSLFAKETMVDSFLDNTGRWWFRIERHERATETEPWLFHSIISESRDATRGFRKENNLLFINFIFPPAVFASWNPTAFIDPDFTVLIAGEDLTMFMNWESSMTTVDEPQQIGDLYFEQTSEITHANFENLIELRRVNETYARNFGLVYREVYILDTQEINGSIPWEVKGEQGFILRQTLIALE